MKSIQTHDTTRILHWLKWIIFLNAVLYFGNREVVQPTLRDIGAYMLALAQRWADVVMDIYNGCGYMANNGDRPQKTQNVNLKLIKFWSTVHGVGKTLNRHFIYNFVFAVSW